MNNFPSRDEFENLGSIYSFRFAPVHGLNPLPFPAGPLITGPLSFKSGFSWLTGYFTLETPGYDAEAQDNNAGPFLKYAFSAFYPLISEDASALFQEMMQPRFILDVTDNNYNRKLIGSPENGLSFKFKEASGTSGAVRNGYAFSFFGEQPKIFNYTE